MKNGLLNSFFRMAAAFALLLSAGACKDDVALPMQSITLSSHAILAPSFATTLSFDVAANCEWQIFVTGNDDGWAELSQVSATGTATVSVMVDENTTAQSRSLTIRAVAKRNADVTDELIFEQASASAEGYLSIPELRALAADGDYTVSEEMKLRGIVVSSVQDNNYFENCLALQSALKPGCGITLRTDETLYRNPGEELEIDLKGAVVGVNAETGVMELKPVSDDRITRTETSQVKIEALKITYEELRSGAYESMYAGLYSQVYVPEGGSLGDMTLKDNLSMQDPDNNRFRLVASQASSFGIDPAPTGSGVLKGIVVPQDGAYAIRPCTAEDKELTGLRFGAQVGIRLPYVFSFYAASQANKDCKYVTVTDGSFDKLGADFKVEDKDVSKCVVLTAKVASTSNSSHFRLTHWADEGAHDNIPAKSMVYGQDSYFLLTVPLAEDMPASFRISFGMSGTGGAPKNWAMAYSTDGEEYVTPSDGSTAIAIPEAITGSGYFYYFTVTLTPQLRLMKGQTLLLKLYPTDNVSCNGGTAGYNSDSRLHSCIAIEAVPKFSTSKPAGAVYFEPFDGLTEGLDYLYGDKLAAMLNYCGSDISEWSAELKNGLSGTHVRQRPGYAQIGYVESQAVKRAEYKNEAGALLTPALNAAGDLNLSFRAMAYKTCSDRPKGKANEPKDKKGDLTEIVVEVVGGGTINGATKAIVSGLATDAFNTYSLKITGATASTQLRFTSEPASDEFSRWFIDDIYVTK